MARNYIDVPILICKAVLAKATCTTGCVLKGGDTGGWADATATTAAAGAYAVETISAGTYGSVMIVGTFWGSAADTIKAGAAAMWSATAGVIDVNADCAKLAIGTVIDGTGASATTTRATRVLITGAPTPIAAWV